MKWKSIKVSLPKPNKLVLIHGTSKEKSFVSIAFYHEKEQRWKICARFEDIMIIDGLEDGSRVPVTHWMEFPNKPKDIQ